MGGHFSKIGFVLASLGSAIGLGHIWRFPYVAGVSGGGAFVLLFLFLSLSIGAVMFIAEMLLGQSTQKNPTEAFKELDPSPKKHWKYAGLLLISGPLVLTFYGTILGWVFYYLVDISFNLPTNIQESEQIFNNTLQSLSLQIIGLFSVLGLTGLIVSRGIKEGIEKLNLVLMPLLFATFFGLLFYAMTLDSFSKAFHFMFDFKPHDLTPQVFTSSLGQVFFSLSIGLGINIAYAASTEKTQDLLKSTLWVVISGIVISLVAGLMIFTFVFEHGANISQGTGLIFTSLPVVFGKMGTIGIVVSVLFLLALAFAGITSTVALLEPSVMYFTDKYQCKRSLATWGVIALIFIVGVVLIFSLHNDYKESLSFFGKNLFDWLDFISSTIIMPLGGVASFIFIGWVLSKEKVRSFSAHFLSPKLFEAWYFLLKYVTPLIVLSIWASKLS
ncbi:sodium-dependent transporter [Helicobacter cetorum]|uniref:sodium-dependent transporter n=1 Tax=Helicobacter cetorum TaxID=138563 RepID=UPI000CF031B0|nr:sodium-dependent transporter [Helicobacter cetorum]